MAMAKMTRGQHARAKRQAERLKGHREVDNPFALANWQVQKGHKAGRKR